jgi:hypothetical protein
MIDWTAYLTFSANIGRTATEGHKVTLAAVALLLALLWPGQRRPALGHGAALTFLLGLFGLDQFGGFTVLDPRVLFGLAAFVLAWPALRAVHDRLAPLLLVLLTLVSLGNYLRWGPRLITERVDTYDLMHYYLNAKYFDELGYYDLYPACILADLENDGPRWDKRRNQVYMAQDGGVHAIKPISHGFQRGQIVRSNNFTAERWEQFEKDFLYLQREVYGMSDKAWREMIQDHGFNGTPVWTLIARPFAQAIPADRAFEWGGRTIPTIKLIGYLDVIVLAVALGAVAWAYGGIPALWLTIWFCVTYSLRWPTVSWVFLRYDWVAALLLAMVALKKERPYIAGLFAAWSATLRLFPAFWMWGPFSKGVGGLVRRKVRKPLLVLALGFFVGVGVLELGAIGRYGTDQVVVHLDNMSDHNKATQLSSRRIGLALGLAFRGPYDSDPLPKIIERHRKLRIADQKPIRYGLGLLVMLVMGWALRRADDDEAFGYGFVPIYLLTTMSYYYYVARVTLVLVHAADLSKIRNQVGLAMLFGMEVFSNWAEFTYREHRLFLIGYLAWFIAVYIVVMTGFLLADAREQERADA